MEFVIFLDKVLQVSKNIHLVTVSLLSLSTVVLNSRDR